MRLGPVNSESRNALTLAREIREPTKDEIRLEQARKRKPPLNRILNLSDMEVHAYFAMLLRCSFNLWDIGCCQKCVIPQSFSILLICL